MPLGAAAQGKLGFMWGTLFQGPIARNLKYGGNVLWPNELPSIDAAFKAYTSGWITEGRLSQWLRSQGAKWDPNSPRTGVDFGWTPDNRIVVRGDWQGTEDPWIAALWEAWTRWDLSQLQVLVNRGVVSEQLADQILQTDAWESGPERKAILDLRKIIPPPGQILEMALRGALDPQNLGPQALLPEYDLAYDAWTRANGITVVTIPNPVPGNPPLTIDFAAALWALHWQLPTLPEWFEMQRRLRPSLANPGASSDPSGIIIDPALADFVYRNNNIHPQWREALKAISYKPVSLRHVDLMYEFGYINRQGVEEVLLDNGYAPSYATKVARARADKVDRTRRKAVISQAKYQVEKAWEIGSIDDGAFTTLLTSVGLTQPEANEALTLAGVQHTARRLDRSIRALRTQTLTGQINLPQAKGFLLNLGLQTGRVDEYVADWELDLSGRRRLLSARENLKAAEEGLISVEDLVSRLANLHYTQADINIFVGELQLYLVERLAKAAQAAARAREKAQRDAERAARNIIEAFKQAQAALAKHGSPATLKRWFCEGLIGEQEVIDRLTFLSWPEVDIARLLEECQIAAAKKKPPKQPVG